MRTIEISDETFDLLWKLARPFEDLTPEAVIRRLVADHRDDGVTARGDKPSGPSATGSKRASKADTTADRVFYPWIIKVLADLGGSAEKAIVTRKIGEALATRLTKEDWETVTTGETRWENRVAWGRNRLKEIGFIDSN